jgi:hypothetical protein
MELLAFVFSLLHLLAAFKQPLLFEKWAKRKKQGENKPMAKNKKQTWAKRYWILNEPWTKAFFASHIFGWTIAWIQTLWLVAEVRKNRKK